MRIISDLDQIEQRFGFHPIKNLTAPCIQLDAPKMRTPLVAVRGTESILLAREQELGNIDTFDIPEEQLKLFERYVNFDNMISPSPASRTLGEAIIELAEEEPVVVGGDLPYGRYLQIQSVVGEKLKVEDSESVEAEIVVYKVDKNEVICRFAELRRKVLPSTEGILKAQPSLKPLEELLKSERDTRFDGLDTCLSKLGVSAVLCGAPPNVTELTGRALAPGSIALWNRGSKDIYLMTTRLNFGIYGEYVDTFPSYATAIRVLSEKPHVAIEEGWLDVGTALSLKSSGISLTCASKELALWREERDQEDLASNLIAAQASRYCIEGALEFARSKVEKGEEVTELEIYNQYEHLLHNFRRDYKVSVAIEPYFASCFSGNRTSFPARPTGYLVNKDSRTLKIDAGFKVIVDGVILGTSDICRILTFDEDVRRAYGLFTEIIRTEVIPVLRPGISMSEVHKLCVERILPHRKWLISAGLMPEAADLVQGYKNRNVGHLMGRQESFTTEFKPGEEYELKIGSYGAAEIQWPYRNYSIGTEDLWFIGEEQTLNLSI